MSKISTLLKPRGWLCLLAALALLPAPLLAQNSTVTITSASFGQLQSAFYYSSATSTQTVICAFNGTITLTSPLFASGNIILMAPTNYDVTISGAPGIRIFEVETNISLTLSNLTISGGNALGTNGAAGVNTNSYDGGARGYAGGNGVSGGVGQGGAIYNLGKVTAWYCVFLTNTATGGAGGAGGTGGNGYNIAGNGGNGGNGGAAQGGAIYNLGTLIVSNCDFLENGTFAGAAGAGGTNGVGYSAYPGNGGAGGNAIGGAIYNLGSANIQACAFGFNFCEGGASQTAGTPQGNENGSQGANGGAAEGGAIYNIGTNTAIINCTIAENLLTGGTGGNGGGIGAGGSKGGNGGNGGNVYGAGIYNDTGGIVGVTNCTIASSSAYGGTNGVGGTGPTTGSAGSAGIIYGVNVANQGTFKILNSILAYATNGVNAYGTFTDLGFNISSDGYPAFVKTNSHNSLDPLLYFPLTTNGGPTLTLGLQPNSPAVNAIPLTNYYPQLDQRGYPRPLGPRPDIGAVEYGIPTYTISGTISNGNSSITNVTIVATGSGLSYTTMPDTNGNYSFSNSLPADTYTIVPQTTNGFTFVPTYLSVTLAATNEIASGEDFDATATYMIGGVITNLTQTATVNLNVSSNGSTVFYASTTTQSNNVYLFTNVVAGTYQISPQSPSSTTIAFNPQYISILVYTNNTNQNFNVVPPTYPVSGQITGLNGAIVTINAVGSGSATTTTDANGNYSFSFESGSYTITPQPTNGLTFTPPSIFATVPPSTNNQNFAAQGTPTYSISGQVANLHAAIAMKAVSSGTNVTITTDSGGNYSFSNLPAGSFTLTPGPVSGLSFQAAGNNPVVTPPSAINQNFYALPTAPPSNSALHVANQTASFSFTGFPNLTYRVQASTNLINWTNILTTNVGNSGVALVTNSISNFPIRFFREVTP